MSKLAPSSCGLVPARAGGVDIRVGESLLTLSILGFSARKSRTIGGSLQRPLCQRLSRRLPALQGIQQKPLQPAVNHLVSLARPPHMTASSIFQTYHSLADAILLSPLLCVANKELAQYLSPLNAILAKNIGGGVVMANQPSQEGFASWKDSAAFFFLTDNGKLKTDPRRSTPNPPHV